MKMKNYQKYKSNDESCLCLISKGTGHCPVTQETYQTFTRKTRQMSDMDISPCLITEIELVYIV